MRRDRLGTLNAQRIGWRPVSRSSEIRAALHRAEQPTSASECCRRRADRNCPSAAVAASAQQALLAATGKFFQEPRSFNQLSSDRPSRQLP